MLSLNGWTLFFTILNVLVLYLGVKKFLLKPVMNVVSQREELIQNQLTNAAETKKQAEQLKDEYQAELATAHDKAEEIIVMAKERAEVEYNNAIAKTCEETEHMLSKAKADIMNEQEKAKKEAQDEISKLAIQAARKIMKTGDVHDTGSN
ncbi:F0F1 ATP synthase subunit B [Anaerosporobacter sp.]|uniref:F0F1 ATP synthase subunit B n=1 Tax=Anaerosporobacter sp. TaxID=1872529 RepID=UPI0028A18F37|nr:F0F1 ATP synthase subunit B [Anaerosporobacter sp.]